MGREGLWIRRDGDEALVSSGVAVGAAVACRYRAGLSDGLEPNVACSFPRRGNVDKKAATDGPRVAIQATNHTFCSGAVANGS